MRVVLTLFVVLAPAISAAQWTLPVDPGVTRWELTVFGGYRWDGEMGVVGSEGGETLVRAEVEHGSVWGVSLGAPVGADYHVELFWSGQDSVLEGSSKSGGFLLEEEVAIDVAHLSLVRTWRQREGFSTHLGFGAGVTRIEPDLEGFEREDRFSVSAILGLKYPLMRHLAVRLDGRVLWTLEDDALERQDGGTDFPTALDPTRLLQYEITLGLVGRW